MLSPHLKRKVDALWNKFWSAGITNPLVAIEQITYLLFLKRLEALDNYRVSKGKPSIYTDADRCRWSYIKQDRTPQHLLDVVFPWLRQLETKLAETGASENGIEAIGNRMSDAYFQLDPNKAAILSESIDLIDKLFERADSMNASMDVMGDTFEYLLSEIATAGKNGQFRTPRHIIRFMVELLDPEPGAHIVDPAAGTGGFLFSTLQYMLKQNTDPDNLRIEWDGTPYRAYGDQLPEDGYEQIHNGANYTGFDNDRTMVRIGWMNMVLHGIENPELHQRDSLGKRRDDDPMAPLLASERYDYVLANPPFTGTVDIGDLDISAFPRAGKTGKKANQAITGKSELLFVWRMLDLLRIGGRCAVIVPEGVLFGNTDAHIKLRRELLTEHLIEGIISLPSGVFQPYAGVKTSILIFQKETGKLDARTWKENEMPRTQNVWFYEVSDEAYTLDQKRNERKGQNNDLWDAVVKFKEREIDNADDLLYYQPDYYAERWRLVDQHALEVFPDVKEVALWKDRFAAVHELFPDLPSDPAKMEEVVINRQSPQLQILAQDFLNETARNAWERLQSANTEKEMPVAKAALKREASRFTKLCNQQKTVFDQEDPIGWKLFQKTYQAEVEIAIDFYARQIENRDTIDHIEMDEERIKEKIKTVAKAFAKLDGYDVMLRTLELKKREGMLSESKCWSAPVRIFVKNDEWQNEDGLLKGSHDETGQVRPEYAATINLYDGKGNLIDGLLDPDCIEARGWNLSAGQYKPFTFEAMKSDKSVVEMISDLRKKEQKILEGIDTLLAMVEGKV
ncbi:MAG: putative type I restriction enzymeP M protein [Syntrophorhabdus sp. PtaB.Bin006]|nr:MAG: putative type I restriction enzymeP M protein [Syntrophorhabdus sp. PtaB.Bin006]